jgi:hypothetical protein
MKSTKPTPEHAGHITSAIDSNRLVGGRERSVVTGFELGRGDVAEVAVEAFGVVPMHPAERRELDVLDRQVVEPRLRLNAARLHECWHE